MVSRWACETGTATDVKINTMTRVKNGRIRVVPTV